MVAPPRTPARRARRAEGYSEGKESRCIMRSMAGRLCRDEGGTSRAGLVLVMVLVLSLVMGAIEFGGFRVQGDPNGGSVAARQQDALRRSSVASRGAHQPSEQPGVVEQQSAQLATDGQSGSGRGGWQVAEPSATRAPAWGRQLGGLVYETLPQLLWEVLRALGEGVQRIL